MGGKGGSPPPPVTTASAGAEEIARIQAEQSQTVFGEAAGVRQALFTGGAQQPAPGLLGGILAPVPITPLPTRPVSPIERDTLERQSQQARQNILSSTSRGGVQQRLLADVELGRVSGLQQQAARQEQELFGQEVAEIGRGEEAERQRAGRIFQAAQPVLGQTQLGITGLGSAGGILSGLFNTQAQAISGQQAASAQKATGLGQGLGSLGGIAAAGGFGGK